MTVNGTSATARIRWIGPFRADRKTARSTACRSISVARARRSAGTSTRARRRPAKPVL